ncbi:putative E3 ubiquitin-protein ligase TRIML1 isoform 1-T2 [Sarcophilus harrisii]
MKNWLEKFKVNITMDPMTASNFVVICEDLKKVKHGDNCPEQPNCPEKCPYYFVFAEQSFGSGIYYWEVATKSLRKKKTTEYSAGYLYMLRCEKRGNKFYLVTRPGSVCQQMKDPVSIIGIYLDYTERTLLFYDAINASLIYGMHIMALTKPVKPLFSPCPPMPGTTVGYIKICPL